VPEEDRSQSAPPLSFEEFLTAFFESLAKEGVRPCILRNYEEFPASNIGSDVDVLIRPAELPRAIRAIRSIRGIAITGYAERHFVAHLFLEGISRPPDLRALQVDFIWSLCWKGLQYLKNDADTVLEEGLKRQAGSLSFLIPCPVHEAIISLFSSLIVAGQIKEKYFPKVQLAFMAERPKAIATLSEEFGRKTATRLVDSVIAGDRHEVRACVRFLHTSLALRNLLHRTIHAAFNVARYYARECVVCLSSESLQAVCVLEHRHSESPSIIESLILMLQSSAKVLERREFGPRLPVGRTAGNQAIVADAHPERRRAPLIDMARIAVWPLQEWRSRFEKKESFTLRLNECDRCKPLIVSQQIGYHVPRWFAGLITTILPSSDLWLLIDRGPRMQLVLSERSEGRPNQLQAYRSFVKTRRNHVIVDDSQTADCAREAAYDAIVKTLVERTEKKLNDRFRSSSSTRKPSIEGKT
jgi:hypothetical protein